MSLVPRRRSDVVSFRALNDPLGDALRSRAEPGPHGERPPLGPTARRDLQRYYDLLSHALANLHWTGDEVRLLTSVDVEQLTDAGLLGGAVERAIAHDDLARIHRIPDPSAFVQRLKDLSPLECRAVVDGLQRFRLAYAARGRDAELVLDEVGFVRD
jgi:hypothetical protein